jgi:transcriptional regulator with XRE-family HTH domain
MRVRRLRLAKGFSQESFAEACSLHRTYVGSVERGERNISLDNIGKIADALDMTLAELFHLWPEESIARKGRRKSTSK